MGNKFVDKIYFTEEELKDLILKVYGDGFDYGVEYPKGMDTKNAMSYLRNKMKDFKEDGNKEMEEL